MNLSHLRYAVEVANCGSINKAAKNLYIGQPNLSRAIKELEESVGVSIFSRSAKGMELTPDGEVFIKCAKSILKQINDIEKMFSDKFVEKKHFSISVPRASYIGDAFSRFSEYLNDETDAEIFYKETNNSRALKNILEEDYNLGIVRYAENYDKYYKQLFEEKGLKSELVGKFRFVVVTSKDGPLAKKDKITQKDLENYIEIAHADPYVPSVPLSTVKKDELSEGVRRRIFVFERASQLEVLSQNPETFMWVSPLPEEVLSRYGLVLKDMGGATKTYKDVIIYKNNYELSDLDKKFITELTLSRRKVTKS